jgi:hypothetical protein
MNLTDVCPPYTFFAAKLGLKRTIERIIVFKSHHIDEPPALGFSFNFTVGLRFHLKKGWEMEFREKLDWEMESRPPSGPSLHDMY